MHIGEGISGALFNGPERRYRYALWRIWDRDKPKALLVGLNPSKATQFKDDPTIVREVDFCKRWGFGGLYKGNLHPYVTPYPEELWVNVSLEQNLLNDQALRTMLALSSIRVVCWGDQGAKAGDRPGQVLKLLGNPVYCLKVNNSGEPVHPLYQPLTSKLVEYRREQKGN